MKSLKSRAAFSLIEVVMALGVISFALTAIFGLFSVGLKTGKESSDQIQAANLASFLMSMRRGMPTNTISGLALPPLNTPVSSTVTVGVDGHLNPSTSLPGADSYKMTYTIASSTASPHVANVYLLLWWPAQAVAPSTNSPGSYYELSTQVTLP